MNTSSTRIAQRRLLGMTFLAIVVVSLDQMAKAWVRANIALGGEFPVWSGVVHLTYILNRGAAWSMLSGQRWLLVFITVAVVGAIIAASRHLVERGALGAWSVGLILGGAVGNLVDRIGHGAVTDMIDMDTSWHWIHDFPVFNLADSALTLGVFLLILQSLRGETTIAKTSAASVEVSANRTI